MGFCSCFILIGFQVITLVITLARANEIYIINGTSHNSTDLPFPYLFDPTGKPALYGEFTFMAALGWIDENGELRFKGGGMVISEKMILTAAHCVYVNEKLPDTVVVGGNPLTEYNGRYNSFTVRNVTIYPQYRSNQAYHDIAILELNEPLGSPWDPVCLWKKQTLTSDDVTAIGYGLTEFAGMGSQELLKVKLTVFSPDFCKPFFKRQRKFRNGLSSAHICAGDVNGEKDTCQGDSGGPLILRDKGRKFAVGITSTGQACSGFPPAIYTKISSYIGWITEVLREKGQELLDCEV